MKNKKSIKNVIRNIFIEVNRIVKREIDYYLMIPSYALFFLTYRCTAQCQSCNMWKRGQEVNSAEEMSLSEWKRCVDMLAEKGVVGVELFGGDALLRNDLLIPLIKYIVSKGMHANLTTNGNLLTRETAIQLANSGLADIYVSIDAEGELHDRMRGCSGIFERAKKGIQYLIEERSKKKSPEIICNSTISALNVEHVEKIVMLAKNLKMDSVHLEYIGAITEENRINSSIDGLTPEPYFVSPEKLPYLNRSQAYKLKEKLVEIKSLSKKTDITISTKNIDMLTIDNLINGTFPNKKCYICRYMISIDPFGNIMPCPFFNNYITGNIKEEDLSQIWNNEKHRSFMKYQVKKKIRMCKNCILGVQRNISFLQSFVRLLYRFRKKGKM